jgi:hypothetical protein
LYGSSILDPSHFPSTGFSSKQQNPLTHIKEAELRELSFASVQQICPFPPQELESKQTVL